MKIIVTVDGGLPIEDFPVKGGRKRTGTWRDQPRNGASQFGPLPDNEEGKVVAQPWRVTHRFKRSFAPADGNFVSVRPHSRSLQSLYGPSVAEEIVKDQIAAVFESEGPQLVEKVIIRRIGRLL